MCIDLSIIVPCVRPHNLPFLIQTAEKSVGKYSVEFIIVGPFELGEDVTSLPNVHFVNDYGCPSRCVQIGSIKAKGRFIAWGVDDGHFIDNNSLEDSLTFLYDKIENGEEHCELVFRYFEGIGRTGGLHTQPDGYWNAHYHADLRLPGIPVDYLVAPLGMCSRETFYKFGGLDCSMQHVNFCCHDLGFRIQYAGYKVYLPPKTIMTLDWSHATDPITSPILSMTQSENDMPIFKGIYSDPNVLATRTVSFNNWMDSPPVWERRFNVTDKFAR